MRGGLLRAFTNSSDEVCSSMVFGCFSVAIYRVRRQLLILLLYYCYYYIIHEAIDSQCANGKNISSILKNLEDPSVLSLLVLTFNSQVL